MAKKSKKHLVVKISDYAVYTACGLYGNYEDKYSRKQVNCKNCKKSEVFKDKNIVVI